MSDAGDSGEKDHDPTPRRLAEARSRGDVPQSPDLATAAGYGGFVLACLVSGAPALQSVAAAAAGLLDQSDRLGAALHGGSAAAGLAGFLMTAGRAVAPFFLMPGAAALMALIAQRALTFAPDKLAPRLSRLSVIAGLGHKFGPQGLVAFAKSTVKLVIVSTVLGWFLLSRMDEMVHSIDLAPALATVVLLRLATAFLCLVLLVATVMGLADFLWQRHRFLQRHRMSRQEIIDEFKQTEGDPHAKSQRRQRGHDIAMNRMLRDVPGADVVIVNPTHYAVALVWNRAGGTAPVCVAKGRDEVAARIREGAMTAGVPIRSDPRTARALYAGVAVGHEIRPEHYRAVAAAIRFSEAMRRKAGGRT